ncbi:flagellar basal body L-ring protein FlgH [Ketobacter alkanivorans]|uniref:Basal body L-ring protein n=1 Tax=Ketobacter alkanivorans TaxID=1917421 RepID=A0A2K9LL56_9GAMM|nr:flagellar basal body L-ring protein FlgH [Ketobacter alkanivorans]AUM12967.1 hypothetical protein Kalk_11255 [Ketobacter alkanivorans]
MSKYVAIFSVYLISSMMVQAESLYSDESFRSFVADKKAVNVGDRVTVVIVEASKAKSNNGASMDESFGVSGSVGTTDKTEIGSIDLGMGRESGGYTRREGELRAQVSATLMQEDEHGYFYVQGTQSILINGEEQVITIKGWLRTHDVDQNNIVLSTRLADAEIEYQGFGDKSETEDQGFVSWLFNKIGLI